MGIRLRTCALVCTRFVVFLHCYPHRPCANVRMYCYFLVLQYLFATQTPPPRQTCLGKRISYAASQAANRTESAGSNSTRPRRAKAKLMANSFQKQSKIDIYDCGVVRCDFLMTVFVSQIDTVVSTGRCISSMQELQQSSRINISVLCVLGM